MRTGVTIEDVTRAGDELLAQGERPTVESVRRVLGTGAPATVNTLLKDYFKALPARLNLPAPIATAAAELYKKVREAAQEEVDQREKEREAAVAREREALAAERNAFEAERGELRSSLATATTELAGARERIAVLERQLSLARDDVAEQSRRASAADARAQAAADERERLVKKHETELAQVRERADGNERHFLAQIEDLRGQNKRLLGEREKDQALAAKRASELETQIGGLNAEMGDLRKEAIRLTADLSREQRGRTAAEASLAALTDRHASDQVQWQAQREALAADRDRAQQLADQLRDERDRFTHENATLKGKVEVLEAQLAKQEVSRKGRKRQLELPS